MPMELDNDEFFNMVNEMKKEGPVTSYIPRDYINNIERDFNHGEKIICHPKNAGKYLMQRGARFDWNNNFYERVPPKKETVVKGTSRNQSDRRAGIYDSLSCYVKDDEYKVGAND